MKKKEKEIDMTKCFPGSKGGKTITLDLTNLNLPKKKKGEK